MNLKRQWKGSFTVEMSVIVPLVLFIFLSLILSVFYFHDKNIIAGAAYETAVVGSAKARLPKGADPGELEELYYERTMGKCILFPDSEVNISVGEKEIVVDALARKRKFGLSIRKTAAVTDPEKHIRDIRRVKGTLDGT